jgi:CRP-like cAMP-binding protein
LEGACRFHRVAKGEILFFPSDPAESIFIVRSGIVSIVLNSPDGRELVIDEVRAGQIFGDLEVLTRQARVVGAVARSNGELLVIPCGAFLDVLDAEPLLARRILELTANRWQASARRQEALAFMNAQSRLAHDLLTLEEQEREKGYITVSQEELAHGSGLIRQTVAKALGDWRRKGWLLTGRGRIVILNRKALEQVESGLLH